MSLAPRLAAFAATQGGVFTTAQARAAGYDDREIYRLVKSRVWSRLRRGVYIETSLIADDDEGRHLLQLRAVLLRLQGPVVASHVTSAILHQISLLYPDYSLVHVTRDGVASARTEAGVRHHDATLPFSHLDKVDGILVTAVARTIIDIARESSFDAALVAAESALNKKLTTRDELLQVLDFCRDWPGAREAGRVVSFASLFSETPGETLGRVAFEELGIPQPLQQVSIFDDKGFIARVDYFWKDRRTVGEFDGRQKYTGENADGSTLYKEKLREDRVRDTGLEFVRFGWVESLNKSPSIRRKTFGAFDRSANSAAPPKFRFELPSGE